MAIAHDFDYCRPASLEQALKLMHEYNGRARILAGGTDLIVYIKEGMAKPELLIDIKDIVALNDIIVDANSVSIGAGVTFRQLIESRQVQEYFPILWDAAKTVASTGVRSRATLAGNICSAVPSLDSAPALLCYDASVCCQSVSGKREIQISEWFLAPRKTSIEPSEVVTNIRLSIPPTNSSGVYMKLGRYGGEDLAQAGWGIHVSKDFQYRIAHCALAPVPKRALLIEAALSGHAPDEHLIPKVIELIPDEISPITDIRSSKEYRLHVSGVMLRRGLNAAFERLEGKVIEPHKLLGGIA